MKKTIIDFVYEYRIILIVGLFALLVLGGFSTQFFRYELSAEPGDWGTFGDYIGGILNPVVAFAAFIYLFKSVEIQRKELKRTSEALEKSSTAMNDSNNELKYQADLKMMSMEVDIHTALLNKAVHEESAANENMLFLRKSQLNGATEIYNPRSYKSESFESAYRAANNSADSASKLIEKYKEDLQDISGKLGDIRKRRELFVVKTDRDTALKMRQLIGQSDLNESDYLVDICVKHISEHFDK